MGRFSALLQKIPTPTAGLALATASLSSPLAQQFPAYGTELRTGMCSLATIALTLVLAKLLFFPAIRRKELQCNIVGSVMPTATMGVMVIAAWLAAYWPVAGEYLWLTAIGVHALLLVSFVCYQAKTFSLQRLLPSWFVPPIGIVVACVTSTGMGHESLSLALLWFGLVCYALMLPVMLYRILFVEKPDPQAFPPLAIMAAPASLTLAGYLTVVDKPGFAMLAVLFPLAVMMTVLIYIAFFRLLRLPFSPGYAAFTFPMVIGATALLKLQTVADGLFAPPMIKAIACLAQIELVVATLMVGYVGLHYLFHIGFNVIIRGLVTPHSEATSL